MAREVVMPALEMAQDTAVLVRWLKSEGEQVQKGEPLMEIETDKAVSVIESPASGVLSHISARDGDEVPIGRVIALLVTEQEIESRLMSGREAAAQTTDGNPLSEKLGQVHGNRNSSSQLQRTGDVGAKSLTRASPKARRLAASAGIDLSTVVASGSTGEVTASDVLQATSTGKTGGDETLPCKIVPLRGNRRSIAQRLSRSAQVGPLVHLSLPIDMSCAVEVVQKSRDQRETGHEEPISITSLICKASALALLQHSRLNAHLVNEEIREFDVVHLGVAVALDDGLIVPVLRNAHRKPVAVLRAELRELANRAREVGLPRDAIRGSTFTISNLGMYGIERFTAIVNPPEVAILSVGAIFKLSVPFEDGVATRSMMYATVNVDHRAVDGAAAARFLQAVKAVLESPSVLLIDSTSSSTEER